MCGYCIKKAQHQLLSADQCQTLLEDVFQLPLMPMRSSKLIFAAIDQAMLLSMSDFDASYLAFKHGDSLLTVSIQLVRPAACLACLAGESLQIDVL
jgi:hypothetical protein